MRVFAEPKEGSAVIAEIPSDSQCRLVQQGPLYCEIEAEAGLAQKIRENKVPIEKTRGWVDTKNVLTTAGTDLEFVEVLTGASDVVHEAGGETLFLLHIECVCRICIFVHSTCMF